jgi:hypothetical protein
MSDDNQRQQPGGLQAQMADMRTASIIEAVIARGDLSKLTEAQRNEYYLAVCKSTGLNPVTRPFEYMTLSGKMVLYARKEATEQLRSLHRISVIDLNGVERNGLYVVTAKVQDRQGRTDIGTGAVSIASLRGEALANAVMKAETKAKRRATLSISGLGFLDESEIDDVPQERPPLPQMQKPAPSIAPSHDPETGEVTEKPDADGMVTYLPMLEGETWQQWGARFIAAVRAQTSLDAVDVLIADNAEYLASMQGELPKMHAGLDRSINQWKLGLEKQAAKKPDDAEPA